MAEKFKCGHGTKAWSHFRWDGCVNNDRLIDGKSDGFSFCFLPEYEGDEGDGNDKEVKQVEA